MATVRLTIIAMAQEFGDAVAQCVHHCPDQRPSAEHLLKHKFFKLAAKHPQHPLQQLWKRVPEQADSAAPVTDSEAGKQMSLLQK